MSNEKTMATESFQELALDTLKGLIESATQAGDFIKGQIPLVIQELLNFNTALFAAGLAASIAGAVCTVLAVRWALRKDDGDWTFAALMIGMIGGIASVVGICCNIVPLLKITLAPRVWLIEYAAGLVR